MFRKELADVLKQTAVFLAAVIGIHALCMALKILPRPFFAVVFPVLQVWLLFWALFLGATFLGRERRNNALEYALSLPHPRSGLMARMVGPRVLVWAGLAGVYFLAQALWGRSGTFLPAAPFLLAYASLFLIALSLSLFMDSFTTTCLSTLFVVLFAIAFSAILVRIAFAVKGFSISTRLLTFGWLSISWLSSGIGDLGYGTFEKVWGGLFLLLPFGFSFRHAFSRFDMRPSGGYKKAFLKSFFLSAPLAAAAAFGMAYASIAIPRYFNLLPGGRIIEYRPLEFRIHGPGGSKVVPDEGFYPRVLGMEGSRLFYQTENAIKMYDDGSGQITVLFTARGKRSQILYPRWHQGRTIFFLPAATPLLRFPPRSAADARTAQAIPPSLSEGLALVEVSPEDRVGRPVRAIVCPIPGIEKASWQSIIGMGERGGLRYWLIRFPSPGEKDSPAMKYFQFWEDGRFKEIRLHLVKPIQQVFWINESLLIVDAEGLKIAREADADFKIIKTIPLGFSVLLGGDDNAVGLDPIPEIFGKVGAKVVRLDLRTLDAEVIGVRSTARGMLVIGRIPGGFFLWERADSDVLRISRIQGREITLLREFKNLPVNRRDIDANFEGDGIEIRRGRHYQFFAFPDLREIRYPGLH